MSSPAHASSTEQPAITAVVSFGDPFVQWPLDRSSPSASAVPVIRPGDADRLSPETSRHLLTMVDARSLPLARNEARILSRLFAQGSPVFVRMDSPTPDDLVHVTAAFGIAPTTGDAILRKDGEAIAVFASSPESSADVTALPNYPAAPRQGIDHVVGRAGTRPVVVGPEYAGTPAVSDDQRWRIEVLRQGL
ncbi:hypothetical protein [Luteibacter rhizovicinus]|nr:hypothetical protein [Luteibacter rhizovicinus]